MSAHPRGSAAHSPNREAFAQTQQPREDHERKTDDAVNDADDGSAACAADRKVVVGNIDGAGNSQADDAAPKPSAVCLIDAHRLTFCPSFREPCCKELPRPSCRRAFARRIPEG